MTAEEIIARLKEIVIPYLAELAKMVAGLAERPLEEFQAEIDQVTHLIAIEVMRIANCRNFLELDLAVKAFFFPHLVSEINGLLPIDYPYLAVIVEYPDGLRFGSMHRQMIPGAHDMLSRKVIPIASITNLGTGKTPRCLEVVITDIKFGKLSI